MNASGGEDPVPERAGRPDRPDRTNRGERRQTRRRPVRIGLTGPIGCGKTTVGRWLAELGAVVIDADEVTRGVMGRDAPVLAPIFERFGSTVRRPDGSLDRAALGRIVFGDPRALADLEKITHPVIRPALEAALAAADATGAPAVVLEAIKLIEAGYHQQCDEVWLVTCGSDAQRERLIARGVDPVIADQRIAAQADLAERLAPFATRIVATQGAPEDVRAAVEKLYASALEARRDGEGGPPAVRAISRQPADQA